LNQGTERQKAAQSEIMFHARQEACSKHEEGEGEGDLAQ